MKPFAHQLQLLFDLQIGCIAQSFSNDIALKAYECPVSRWKIGTSLFSSDLRDVALKLHNFTILQVVSQLH